MENIKLSAEFGKVAVLMGGTSNEREVSLQSGHAVLDALKNRGIDAHPLDPKIDSLEELRNFDRAFICLHGIEGEDGKMQGILDEMMIPYTGSGREASAIGMDKFISKSIWEVHNVLTPKFIKINHESNYEKITQLLDLPFFVKPANSGSSIGINKVRSKEDFLKAFEEANDIDERRSDSSHKSEVKCFNFRKLFFFQNSFNSLHLFHDFVETTWSEI